MKRFFRDMVLDTGESHAKGFSVDRLEEFLSTVRPLLQPDVKTSKGLPY